MTREQHIVEELQAGYIAVRCKKKGNPNRIHYSNRISLFDSIRFLSLFVLNRIDCIAKNDIHKYSCAVALKSSQLEGGLHRNSPSSGSGTHSTAMVDREQMSCQCDNADATANLPQLSTTLNSFAAAHESSSAQVGTSLNNYTAATNSIS